MYVPVLLSLAVLLVCSLVMALPKGNMGCLMDLLHLLAFIGGSLAPALLVYFADASQQVAWWFWPSALLSMLFSACALGLAAFGWQTFFPAWITARKPKKQRRNMPGKQVAAGKGTKAAGAASAAAAAVVATPDLEQQIDLSIFDPSAYMVQPQGVGSHSNADPFGDCLFAIFFAIAGGIFWLGLQLAQGIAGKFLPSMPDRMTLSNAGDLAGKRATRTLLCFAYAFAIMALTTIGLGFLDGRLLATVG